MTNAGGRTGDASSRRAWVARQQGQVAQEQVQQQQVQIEPR